MHSESSLPSPLITGVKSGHSIIDRKGTVWVVGYGEGLFRFIREPPASEASSKEHWVSDFYGQKDGLGSNFALAIFEDWEGNIWVGSPVGLDRFRESKMVSVPSIANGSHTVLAPAAGGLMWAGFRSSPLVQISPNDQVTPTANAPSGVTCAFVDKNESVWFGSSPRVWHWTANHLEQFRLPDIVQGSSDVQAITRSADGDLWASVVGFGVFRRHNGTWIHFDSGNGSLNEYVTSLFSDGRGGVWLAYHDRVVLETSGHLHVFGRAEGLGFGDVLSFTTRGSLLWAGGQVRLAFFSEGKFHQIHLDDDSPLHGITGTLATGDGSIWVQAMRTVIRIPASEVDQAITDETYLMHAKSLSFQDGLPGLAPQIRPLPSAMHSSDERLWFSTTSGVAWIDPSHQPFNTPPSSFIRGIEADAHAIDSASGQSVPPETDTIAVSFGATALSVPEQITFRYFLDGYDTAWQSAGTRRVAYYTNVPPGKYTFHVRGSNEDGISESEGSAVVFTVTPAFYQRTAFRICCGIGVLVLLWLFYRVRLQVVTVRLR